MSFNTKLASALLNQNPKHRPHLDAFDLAAEMEGTAICRASKPTFKGKRQLNKPPARQSLRWASSWSVAA
jgi:hypothetical protein